MLKALFSIPLILYFFVINVEKKVRCKRKQLWLMVSHIRIHKKQDRQNY